MIRGYTDGVIPDYQMASMCMAIRQCGMTARESTDLTIAMMHSGDVADLSDLPGIKLDKHSTGGVGDTTTLVVAPLVAACGGTVAKMSGRGLGHTGGTLDKLEAIPGTDVELSMERFCEIVRTIGVAVIGQSENLVPADKKMYALRDVTATVRSIPLIASSIMSKKLASGANAIVLDVKTGSGAFMRRQDEAEELARLMVDIGTMAGRKVRAAITNMNQPLGMAIGNALEVKEAVELLSGNIPENDPLFEVCMVLGANMLELGGLARSKEEAEAKLREKIYSGDGLRRLHWMIDMQGGDASYLDPDRIEELVAVRRRIAVPAPRDGYVTGMQTEGLGIAARLLGAGRETKGQAIDPAVGLVMQVRCGYHVDAGDPLAVLYVNDERNLDEAEAMVRTSVFIEDDYRQPEPMVLGVIE